MHKTYYSIWNFRYEAVFDDAGLERADAFAEIDSHVGLCLRHAVQLVRDGDGTFTARVLNGSFFGRRRDENLHRILKEMETFFDVKIENLEEDVIERDETGPFGLRNGGFFMKG